MIATGDYTLSNCPFLGSGLFNSIQEITANAWLQLHMNHITLEGWSAGVPAQPMGGGRFLPLTRLEAIPQAEVIASLSAVDYTAGHGNDHSCGQPKRRCG